MFLSRLIAIGFLGSIFAMFRFAKFCRLLSGGCRLDPEEAERYRSGAQRWLAAAGILFCGAVFFLIVFVIVGP